MGWYRRSSRFIFYTLHSSASRIAVPKNLIHQSFPKNNINGFSSQLSFRRSTISEICLPVFRNPCLQNGINRIRSQSPFHDGAKRFYYIDNRQVRHFKPRGYKRWVQNPRNFLILVLVSAGGVITIYFGNLETVPYTKRTHFVLVSKNLERQLGDDQFNKIKTQFKGKIMPPLHPDSIKVQSIAHDIIGALQMGLRKEQVWSDIRYAPEAVGFPQDESLTRDAVKALSDNKLMDGEKWHNDEEILDDKWVQQSRKNAHEKGKSSETGHLEGLKWEVIVVDEPMINAFCLPGGKIVVFTGLLKHFRAEAEIATIIGHEVGHVVARHSAENMSKSLWLTILQLILYQFFMPDVVNTMSNLFLRLPFSRRMEMEADYIGLLLLASAGYDPRVAPQVYEKLGKVTGDMALQDYLATHPSGQKRARNLAQAKVMEEALTIYREAMSGRGIEGFL